ncbi:hypothetical protein [Priestia koreensis]|uniref:hypothetical protein n=1 Tax=Priestia koreensis TaxID=284581 RepID=UPI00345A01E9
MFAGFNLEGINNEFLMYKEKGHQVLKQNKSHIEKELENFLLNNGSIDGTKMQNDWFPQINADVFISHSHSDEEKAIALAGWLKEKFDLTAFIDSYVWGYSANLLKKIDDEYCKNTNRTTYNYDKRNFSTSHVHMMLSMALTKMIDKTECILFLNTPNSVVTEEVVEQTKSPWIYHEIGMTKLIRKQEPKRPGFIKKGSSLFENAQGLDIVYKLDVDHLKKITVDDLNTWEIKFRNNTYLEALDVFYLAHGFVEIGVKN